MQENLRYLLPLFNYLLLGNSSNNVILLHIEVAIKNFNIVNILHMQMLTFLLQSLCTLLFPTLNVKTSAVEQIHGNCSCYDCFYQGYVIIINRCNGISMLLLH